MKQKQQKETIYQSSLNQDQSQDKQINFLLVGKSIFEEKGGKIYIGGEVVEDNFLDVLRSQAKHFKSSQLFEILNSTITNEASNLALIQSANWDHVQYAKALHHWNHVLKNIIHTLAK